MTFEFGVITLDLITGFTAKQITDTTSPVGIDSKIRHVRFFKGWSGSFNIERRNSVLDDLFAAKEIAYWAGISEQADSITETIQENNGNVTQWRYTGVLLSYDDAGNYAGDATVKQSMSFLASKRLKIA